MADDDKAEKLAAAKKRFEQLKKQKGKKGKKSDASKDVESKDIESKDIESKDTESNDTESKDIESKDIETKNTESNDTESKDIETKDETSQEVKDDETNKMKDSQDEKPAHGRKSSMSAQSKERSDSFRRLSVAHSAAPIGISPGSPSLPTSGDSVNSIYLRQAARLEELEADNRRLSEQLQSTQSSLALAHAELREHSDVKDKAARVDAMEEDLKTMITQLQGQSTRRNTTSSPTVPTSALQAQLDSKTSTVEALELELSSLRSRNDAAADAAKTAADRLAGLESKLQETELSADLARRELAEAKQSLDRASERAVRDGTERTSNETRLQSLSREAEVATTQAKESAERVATLEKKLAAVNNLHKDRQAAEQETIKLKQKVAELEGETARLQEEGNRLRMGTTEEGLDELENDERVRLEAKMRKLESEVYELRNGAWREQRKAMQTDMMEDSMTSQFDDVDLTSTPGHRTQSVSGAGNSLASLGAFALNALRGDQVEDEDDAFDEAAFRQAHEDEARRRVERVKELKRGLKDWQGFRMDLVDLRRASPASGDIFDV